MGFCVQKYNIFAKPLLSWAKNITITAPETKRRDGRNKASRWLKQSVAMAETKRRDG